jgi:hypothetical protein
MTGAMTPMTSNQTLGRRRLVITGPLVGDAAAFWGFGCGLSLSVTGSPIRFRKRCMASSVMMVSFAA